MAFGLIDTSFIDWPPNVDAAYLRGLQTRSGLRFTELGARLDAGLAQVNAGVDRITALLLAPPTTSEMARGGRTSRMVAQKKSQYTIARPQQVERAAHMLAIDENEIALGFTEDGLQEMSIDDFQAQVDGMVAGFQALHRAETLGRLFSDAEVSVDPVHPTTATSPGFAGSGTGANAFAGLYPDNQPLPGGYSHYYRDTAANLIATVKAMRDRLRKWHEPPFDLIGSEAMVAAISADAGFVSAGSALIRVGVGTAEALVDAEMYVGVFDKDIRVHRSVVDFTTDHFVVFKTYGALNPRNPLVWRYDPLRGRNAYVRSRELFPLAEAVAMHKFGVNVNDRTAAALARIAASGAYAAPTLTY
jgi:hypothetical protein